MRPHDLKTRIFLDSGDPEQTAEVTSLLGFLDGQTTNPTLISKNSHAKEQLEQGKQFSHEEILAFYKQVVQDIAQRIPDSSVSVEVYADVHTSADQMVSQARNMYTWIPNAHIKLPTTTEGLTAAEELSSDGIRINMTLCFSQAQAAAVHAATRGATRGSVFVSPFIGRLDDRGKDGMSLIRNILTMYREVESHVEVLTASVRRIEHLQAALALETDIVTVPYRILKAWGEADMPRFENAADYDPGILETIPYESLDLSQPFTSFDVTHELTQKGMESFSDDWNALIR